MRRLVIAIDAGPAKTSDPIVQPAPAPDPGPVTGLRLIPLTYTPQYVVRVVWEQKSEADVMSAYRAMQQKYPSVLGASEVTVRSVDRGGGNVVYWGNLGPFGSLEEARILCAKLMVVGGGCQVLRSVPKPT